MSEYDRIAAKISEEIGGQYDIDQIVLFLNRYEKSGYDIQYYTVNQLIKDAQDYVNWSLHKPHSNISELILFSVSTRTNLIQYSNNEFATTSTRTNESLNLNTYTDAGISVKDNRLNIDIMMLDNILIDVKLPTVFKERYKDTVFDKITVHVFDLPYDGVNRRILYKLNKNFLPPKNLHIISPHGNLQHIDEYIDITRYIFSNWTNKNTTGTLQFDVGPTSRATSFIL